MQRERRLNPRLVWIPLIVFAFTKLGCARDSSHQGIENERAGAGGASQTAGTFATVTAGGSLTSGGNASSLGRDTVSAPPFVLRGGQVYDQGAQDVFVDTDGLLHFLHPGETVPGGAPAIDVSGETIMPAFIDSHVHLAYYDVRMALPRAGVLAAVDLAAPVETLTAEPTPFLTLLSAGPMITAPLGYPTQSWGQNGFGREVTSPEEARAAATELLDLGASVLKIPFEGEPFLTDEQVRAVVEVAEARGTRVATHALTEAVAARARALGCSILAHTPTEPLSAATVDAWSGGAVISTLAAFGAGSATLDNLRRLRDAGTTLLYGTDLGNLLTSSLSIAELEALERAGLTSKEIIASFTTTPSEYFNLSVGRLAENTLANLVVVTGDPEASLSVLVAPALVVANGQLLPRPDL